MGSRAGNRAWLREWPSLRVMELETTESGWACSKHDRGTTMVHYAGIDVSLESASLCVVDATGRIVREAKVASEPDVLIGWFRGLGFAVTRIGLEAGPLSQWLCRHAGSGIVGRIARDPARPGCLQGNADQDRSERRAWHRPADAARLVPSGPKVGPTTPRNFPGRIRELVAGHTTLSTVAEALLGARSTLFEQWQKLEKRLRSLAREDRPVRQLMTAPGVGTVVALTYASAIDDPGRFRSSKAVGAHFGFDPEKVSVGGDRRHRPHFQGLYIEELGDALGRPRRHAQAEGRARPQARRRSAPHAGRWNNLPRRESCGCRSPLT
jgi:hypothetical protein